MLVKKLLKAVLIYSLLSTLFGCSKTEEAKPVLQAQPTATPIPVAVEPTRYLYVASGTTYAGLGVTLSTPSNIISKFDMDGNFVSVVRDYTVSPGDTPVALIDYNATHILALVENTLGRRVEMIAKDGLSYSSFITNSNLSAALKDMILDYSGGLLVSKGTAIEKFTPTGVRIGMGANPFVNNPGGACSASVTNISKIASGPGDLIIMAHAFTAASPNNRISMISKTGYVGVSDCLASIGAPTTAHFPSAILYHSTGKLLVAYGNNTGPIHQIYSYDVTANSITNPVLAFDDISVLQGISEMIELPDKSILVSTSAASFNTVEKFVLNQSGQLVREGSFSFMDPNVFSRSISSMVIGL